jgi:uncharacterized cupredoxin-like copper-binding protein
MDLMERLNVLLAAALIGVSLGAGAHEGATRSKKGSPVVKEQKDWGIAGEARAVNRTIEVVMTDNMRFTPDRIEVKRGETIRFVHKNAGKIMHEFVIGTRKELDQHAAMMLKFPKMEHEEPYMAHVAPGKTGEVIWRFNRAGGYEFACLIPGHYEAGMDGKIKVIPGGDGLAGSRKEPEPGTPARPS